MALQKKTNLKDFEGRKSDLSKVNRSQLISDLNICFEISIRLHEALAQTYFVLKISPNPVLNGNSVKEQIDKIIILCFSMRLVI